MFIDCRIYTLRYCHKTLAAQFWRFSLAYPVFLTAEKPAMKVFYNRNLELHLPPKPSLDCFLGKFEPRCSYKIVLIKQKACKRTNVCSLLQFCVTKTFLSLFYSFL